MKHMALRKKHWLMATGADGNGDRIVCVSATERFASPPHNYRRTWRWRLSSAAEFERLTGMARPWESQAEQFDDEESASGEAAHDRAHGGRPLVFVELESE